MVHDRLTRSVPKRCHGTVAALRQQPGSQRKHTLLRWFLHVTLLLQHIAKAGLPLYDHQSQLEIEACALAKPGASGVCKWVFTRHLKSKPGSVAFCRRTKYLGSLAGCSPSSGAINPHAKELIVGQFCLPLFIRQLDFSLHKARFPQPSLGALKWAALSRPLTT